MSPYLVQVFANAGLLAAVVYLPLLASSLGASYSEIGLLVAAYQGAMFAANLIFGRWADYGDRKKFVVIGIALAGLILPFHCWICTLPLLFLTRFLMGIAAGIFPAALVAYFYSQNNHLGRFTGFGSLGWALGSLLVGIIGNSKIFWVAGLLMLFTSAFAQLTLKPQIVSLRQPFFDLTIFWRNWRIYTSFLLRHLGAFSIWTIFPLYLAHLGANNFWIGLVYALNPLGQFIFMNLLERTDDSKLIRAGLLLSVLVFVAFGIVQRFEQVIPIQIALALSWSCLYLGTLKQLLRKNEEKSTVTGILQSVLSLAAVLGALLESFTGKFGYQTIMFTAAGIAVIGALIYLVAPEN